MLELKSVRAGYGSFQALFDVSLEVRTGEAVGVIGPNGAGKTTLMRAISGLIRPTSGSILLEGVDLAATPAHRIVELGVAHVPESRRLFPRMTVEDNLKMGGFAPAARPKYRQQLEVVYELFPRLRERHQQLAGSMSGGEQQMCAIGRALMSAPKLLLLDEPSAGLAPVLVEHVLRTVDRTYLLKAGSIRAAGTAAELLASDTIREAYLGV
jgi:branched-chain amino acid transport system ATP-binding protein